MGILIAMLVLILLLGTVPAWSYSRKWGYWPSGALGVLLVVLIVLTAMNYIPRGF